MSRWAKSSTYKIIIFVILGLLLVYLGAGWYFSGQIVAPKFKTHEEDRQLLNLPSLAELGLPQPREVEFIPDGLTHRGWFFRGPRRDCGLIVHHGFTATRWGSVPYARHFSRCQILLYDARGHGLSDAAKVSYGAWEHRALLQAVAWLAKETGLGKHQIGLIGESMGAATVLLAASRENGFAFVVADSSYAAVADIIRERAVSLYGTGILFLMPIARFFAEWRGNFSFAEVQPAVAAKDIRDPVLLVHSAADTYTLPAHSQKIYDALPGNSKELFLTDWQASHARSIHTNPEAYLRRLKAFISRYAADYPGLW